jgi:hypothetical protein
MCNFSPHNEKEFLESYAEWTVNIRPFSIKILNEKYKNSQNIKEKEMLHVLAIEQLFLLYEQFEGFFRAIKNRKKKPIFEILKEFDIKISEIPENLREKALQRFRKLSKFFRDEKIFKLMKNIFLPLFNKLKHKLLVYRKNGEICFLCGDREEKKIGEEISKRLKKGNNYQVENLDYLQDMAERFKTAIQDLIAIRLLETQ